jgi:predicted dithiol-disulfide oxidoreductase (DUF899 family)
VTRFPGESDEYRQARDELLAAEVELRAQIERVAAQRRALPLGGELSTDHAFSEGSGQVRISELLGDKDTLFLYSFMWVPESQGLGFVGPCPSCTSIIDGIDGAVPHITQRLAFAVAAHAPIEAFEEHGARRGWRHARLLSTLGSGYSREYGAEEGDGNQWPLATVFVRRDGKIHHWWSSELWWADRPDGQGPRHVDYMWPVWTVLDRTPEGRGDFDTALEY